MGASENVQRYANMAIRKLLNHGHEVVAFGSKKGNVEGIAIDDTLQDWKAINTVTLYLNPKNQEPYYDFILQLNPKRVIFNPGTENSVLQHTLREHNIAFEEACTLVLLSTGQY